MSRYAATSALLLYLADGTTADDSGIKIAVIGAVAVVIAAVIPALLSLRERMPKEIEQLQRISAEDRHRLEAELAAAKAETEATEDKLHELERFVWALGYDPETHQRVTREA